MPDVDGIQLLKKIKLIESLKSIPVFMLSALDDDVILDKCVRNGAMGVMLKPLSRDQTKEHLVKVIPGLHKTKETKLDRSSAASDVEANTTEESRHRVLIVDDSTISGKIAQLCLQKNGFGCDIVKNGLEAIQLLLQTKTEYVAVILDLNMPVLGGFDTLMIMNQNAKLKSIP